MSGMSLIRFELAKRCFLKQEYLQLRQSEKIIEVFKPVLVNFQALYGVTRNEGSPFKGIYTVQAI